MSSRPELLVDLLFLSRAARLVLEEEVVEGFQDQELNISRLNVLRLLARRGAQTVNNLAAFLGFSKAAASQNIDILSRKGFVFRRDDRVDRRTTWVEITEGGQEVLNVAERHQQNKIRQALAILPPEIEKEANRILRELALSLIRTSGSTEKTCLQCCAYRSAGCVREHGDWTCSFLKLARSKPLNAPV